MADYLLPDPEIDDLALDFIEERLGRYNFLANWKRLLKLKSTVSSIQTWLREKGLDVTKANAVAYEVDCMFRRGAKWSS